MDAAPAVAVAVEDELSRIHASHKLVLDAAAVVGDSFEPELVASIAERSVAFTLEALDQLVAADIVRATATPGRFRFRHPIVRRAVYDGIPSGWRLSAHARAAGALIASRAPASTSAHHVERSAMPGDELAVAVLVEAARGAAPRAPLGAGRWLLAALRLLPTEASPERRMGLLTEAATALASGGAYDEALAALEESLALVPPDQAEARADVIAKVAYVKRRSGQPFDSRPVLEHALESLAGSDGRASADLRLELALHSLWHDEFVALTDLAEPLLRLARDQSDLAMVALSAALCSLGSREQGADAARGILAEAEKAFAALSDEQLAGRIYVSFYLGLAELRLERAEEALRHANRGLEVGRLTGQGVTVTTWLGVTSHVALLKGQVADADTTWARRDRHRAPARQRLADDLGARGRRARRLLGRRQRPGARQCTRDGDPCRTNPPLPVGTGDGAARRRRIRRRRRCLRPRQAHRARRRASPASTRPQCRPRVGAADPLAAGAGPNRRCEENRRARFEPRPLSRAAPADRDRPLRTGRGAPRIRRARPCVQASGGGRQAR